MFLRHYLADLDVGRMILWCYLIWYLVIVGFYFEPNLSLLGRCLGLSVIIGIALMLSTGTLSLVRLQTDFWSVFRLFFCPFLVSSFSSLAMGKGFWLVLSPNGNENLIALGSCLLFVALCCSIKKMNRLTATC